MVNKAIPSALAAFLLIISMAQAGNGPAPIPTSDWHDFYGCIQGAGAGDTITIRDPQGVVCGEYIMEREGQYGFIHVYRDDPYTLWTDEGAQAGDIITFYHNGSIMGDATWLGGRIITGLNFALALKGDVDRDCDVDIFDLASVGLAYGSQPGDFNWNENADLYPPGGDGQINIFDLATVGLNYGQTC
jgi:hypothetical protein